MYFRPNSSKTLKLRKTIQQISIIFNLAMKFGSLDIQVIQKAISCQSTHRSYLLKCNLLVWTKSMSISLLNLMYFLHRKSIRNIFILIALKQYQRSEIRSEIDRKKPLSYNSKMCLCVSRYAVTNQSNQTVEYL